MKQQTDRLWMFSEDTLIKQSESAGLPPPPPPRQLISPQTVIYTCSNTRWSIKSTITTDENPHHLSYNIVNLISRMLWKLMWDISSEVSRASFPVIRAQRRRKTPTASGIKRGNALVWPGCPTRLKILRSMSPRNPNCMLEISAARKKRATIKRLSGMTRRHDHIQPGGSWRLKVWKTETKPSFPGTPEQGEMVNDCRANRGTQQGTINREHAIKPSLWHTCISARKYLLLPSLHSSDSSLRSRHSEMRAPCDSPVRSYRTDLCGTSQLSVAPRMETASSRCVRARPGLSRSSRRLTRGARGRCREKSPLSSRRISPESRSFLTNFFFFRAMKRRKTANC